MSIYFDNSATTPVLPEGAKAAFEVMTNNWGNPSSLHTSGIEAQHILKKARKQLALSLRVEEREIYFTSCATESNNLAIFGAVESLKRRGRRVITTAVEHPSVYECFKALEERGFEVIYLHPENGRITEESLKAAITKDTILVSMMAVNNETGDILPIDKVKKIIERAGSPALFHCDAVQGFGKIKIEPVKLRIDLLSISAHKLYGPKGVGAIYVRKGVNLKPNLLGGGQESGLRSGTENTASIAAMGVATQKIFSDFNTYSRKISELYDLFISKCKEYDFIKINSPENGAKHIINISLPGLRSETVLHCLEQEGIFVSSGSACSSHGGETKRARVLSEYGFTREIYDSALRISFGIFNEKEEIEAFFPVLEKIYERLKR